jgi:hypothetical protein
VTRRTTRGAGHDYCEWIADPHSGQEDLVENYSCPACNAKLDSKQKLDGHMEREHPEKAEHEQQDAPAGTTTSRER